MASVHESLYFNPMMTNGVVHANVFGIKDWVTPYKIAVLVLLNEMGRTGEGAVSLVERRRLNQLLLPLLQIECHPYLTQKNLIGFCQSRNVSVTAYLPLGGSSGGMHLMEDPTIQTIAQKHKKSAAQILIRFQIQRNVRVIPKSVNPKRILENFQVFDFELSEEDMTDLLGLDRNLRLSTFPITENHKDYPFRAEF